MDETKTSTDLIQVAQNTDGTTEETVQTLNENFDAVVEGAKDILSELSEFAQADLATLVEHTLNCFKSLSINSARRLSAATYLQSIESRTDLLFSAWADAGGRDSKFFDFMNRYHMRFFNTGAFQNFFLGTGTARNDIQIGAERFMTTNYAQALLSLESVEGEYPETFDHCGIDLMFPKRRAVVAFFTIYPDIDPVSNASLTETQLADLRQLFEDLDRFLVEANATGKENETFFAFLWSRIDAEPESEQNLVPRVTTALVKAIEYPLDKPDSQIWKTLSADQLQEMIFATEKAGSKKEASVIVGINFDALEEDAAIVKHLTPFDKRVYIAVSALYTAGNRVFTASQIYHAMGNTSRPSPARLEKINESLTKMGTARLRLDNSQEVEVNKGYPTFKYDAPLLPFERMRAYINGRLCKSAIQLYREPPLVSFAKQRRQITTLSSLIFEVPLNHTDSELELENFLIEQISRIGKGARNPKILLSSLYADCQINAKKERARTKDKIKVILDHYKKVGFIEGYSIDFRAGEILIQMGVQKHLSAAQKRVKRRETRQET